MMAPTIHANGTSRDSLLDDLSNAVIAIHNAQSALAKAGPNARDYYPQGDDAIVVARHEHRARMDKLSDIAWELNAIAERIAL